MPPAPPYIFITLFCPPLQECLDETLLVLDVVNQVLVPTDGGRYDVDLHARKRLSVYWAEPESQVRRSSWFYKGQDDRWYIPYDEQTAYQLEVSL